VVVDGGTPMTKACPGVTKNTASPGRVGSRFKRAWGRGHPGDLSPGTGPLSQQWRPDMLKTGSDAKLQDKAGQTAQDHRRLQESGQRPEWMVMEVIPVLPRTQALVTYLGWRPSCHIRH